MFRKIVSECGQKLVFGAIVGSFGVGQAIRFTQPELHAAAEHSTSLGAAVSMQANTNNNTVSGSAAYMFWPADELGRAPAPPPYEYVDQDPRLLIRGEFIRSSRVQLDEVPSCFTEISMCGGGNAAYNNGTRTL